MAAKIESKPGRDRLILALLISATVLIGACGGGKKTTDSLFSRDETQDAAALVVQANGKLMDIKRRFKENGPRYEELKTALKAKDEKKVRELSNKFVDEITAGSQEGGEAVDTLKKAKDMNINEDYRQYLDLKIISLEKYIEAFEQRRQAAELLAEGYDPKDVMKRDKVIAEFRQKEDKFNQIIEEGRHTSADANEWARESLRKQK